VANLLPDHAVTPRLRPLRQARGRGTSHRPFKEVLARKARQYGVDVVDLYERSREEVPRRPELVASEGYHPSDLGYARWAELMWTRVEARVPRC
jgi:acyl-CoA thioesterase I